MIENGVSYDASMRTTLTLDTDVGAELQRLARKTEKSFRELANETLRAGLRVRRAPAPRRYRVRPVSLGGVLPGIDLDRALQLADALDDEGQAQKRERRK